MPVKFGLVVASLDMVLWIWYVIRGITGPDHYFGEGLMAMGILHLPASALLAFLGSIVPLPFVTNDSLVPTTIYVFLVGITQYYLIGYLLGKLVLVVRGKFG